LLSKVTNAMSSNNSYESLASLGIDMANDGTLSVDQANLNSVLASHYSDFQNFFQGSSTSFGSHLAADLTSLTSPTTGALNENLAEIKNQQTTLHTTISDFEDRLAARQPQLVIQYSQIDAIPRQWPVTQESITAERAKPQ